MLNNKKVFIIIPSYNRRDITISCVDLLCKTLNPNIYKIIVVDDGSTDGTGKTIQEKFQNVYVLYGDGNLWWTGAISLGMKFACAHQADYMIWLNDDVSPSFNSIEKIVELASTSNNLIVSGQCYRDKSFAEPTYGGQKKEFLSITLFYTLVGQTLPCDCMSGNLVCLPRSVVDVIGFPPADKLPHNMADIVYTWEAKKAGFQLMVCGDATAICEFNPFEEGWSSSSISMIERWKRIVSYKSNLYPPAFWYYCYKFYGLLAPIVFIQAYMTLIVFTILRLFVPLSILVKIKKVKERLVRPKLVNKVARDI